MVVVTALTADQDPTGGQMGRVHDADRPARKSTSDTTTTTATTSTINGEQATHHEQEPTSTQPQAARASPEPMHFHRLAPNVRSPQPRVVARRVRVPG